MFPQLDPTEARYLAEIIVSILGVVLFLGLAIWIIRRKQTAKPTEPTPVAPTPTEAGSEPRSAQKQEQLHADLVHVYQTWKTERLLQSEDGRSLFLRNGVEKNGLRYQLVAKTQVQALAIYLCALMAEADPQASVQAEALFASLLAHPAYGHRELSSWQYLPDLPRSPRLDPDPHAEAWVILALKVATKRWAGINRFNYTEIIPEKLQALREYTAAQEPEMVAQLSFSGFLTNQLLPLNSKLDWSELGESREQFFARFLEPGYLRSEPVASRLGMSLFQLGMLALLERDLEAIRVIRTMQAEMVGFAEEWMITPSEEPDFSRVAMLASAVPALLSLEVKELNERVWNALRDSQPDKNDGLGATLKVIAMAFLAGEQGAGSREQGAGSREQGAEILYYATSLQQRGTSLRLDYLLGLMSSGLRRGFGDAARRQRRFHAHEQPGPMLKCLFAPGLPTHQTGVLHACLPHKSQLQPGRTRAGGFLRL